MSFDLSKLPQDADGDALRRIAADGSDLTKAMEIDFAVDVPSEQAGKDFAKAIAHLPYQTSLYFDEEEKAWTCYCSKTLIPSYEAILQVQEELTAAGAPFDAVPDGWGTYGNAP